VKVLRTGGNLTQRAARGARGGRRFYILNKLFAAP
jgi:hypothetical protein